MGQTEPHFEFFGPYIGPIGIILGLPSVMYALIYVANASGYLTVSPFTIPGFPANQSFFTWEAVAVVCGWMLFQILLHLILPGIKAEGTVLPGTKNARLTYKLTGLRNFIVTLAAVGYFSFYRNDLNLSWVYDNYVPLMTAATALSAGLSMFLYIKSFTTGALLAAGGNTGVTLYDFFIGRELNPRIGSLDLKEFCELYPGLIGWIVLNLGMAHKQLITTGTINPSMVLVCIFQAIYVWDALWFEKAILTTMDITTDGFGFMLAFGDLAWVPFTYSLQARILVDHSPNLSNLALAALVALKLFGYAVFRGANGQKDMFRTNPKDPRVSHLKTMPTKRGTKLIVSGWWGIARHINYTGDWMMGWAWCLPVGPCLVAYFYVAYFGALLVHRDMRDEHACRLKYGSDWDKYCKKVPYRLLPYIY